MLIKQPTLLINAQVAVRYFLKRNMLNEHHKLHRRLLKQISVPKFRNYQKTNEKL